MSMSPDEKDAVRKLKKAEKKRSARVASTVYLYAFKVNKVFGFPFGAPTDEDAKNIWLNFIKDKPEFDAVHIYRIGEYNTRTSALTSIHPKIV